MNNTTSDGHHASSLQTNDPCQKIPTDVDEILLHILELCEKPELSVCARVSKRWSDLVLDHLWRGLSSIDPVLRLISPLQHSNAHYSSFRNPITATDWDRFKSYATRVKSLSFEDAPSEWSARPVLQIGEMQAAIYHHPFGTPLLPNLAEIHWSCRFDKSLLLLFPFMGSQLTTLTLEIEQHVDWDDVQILLGGLRHRAPNLKHFELSYNEEDAELDTELRRCFETMPLLQSVKLPPYCHTAGVLASLARHKLLRELSLTGKIGVQHDRGVIFPSSGGEYACLRDLAVDMDLLDAAALFRVSEALPALSCLELHLHRFTKLDDLYQFLDALTTSHPTLTKLCIDFLSNDPNETPAITWSDLRPLHRLSELRSLEILHWHPLRMSPAHIKEMGLAWSAMTDLSLTPDPQQPEILSDVPDISILVSFASAFPNLSSLSLFVNIGEIVHFNGDLNPPAQFHSLERLNLGFYYLEQSAVYDVAFFLASLCQSPPVVECASSKQHWRSSEALEEMYDQRQRRWDEVKKLLPLVLRSKRIAYPM